MLLSSNPLVRKCLRLALEREGYAIASAEEPGEASGLIHFLKPDVILIDADAWGRSGFQACRELRTTPSARASRIVLLGPEQDQSFRNAALAAGATAILAKPIQLTSARTRVREVLRRRGTRDEGRRTKDEGRRTNDG